MVCTVRIVFSFVLPVWHSAGHGMGCGAVLHALHFFLALDFALRLMYAWCGVYGIVYVVYFVQYGVFCVVGIGGMVLGMWHWGVWCCLACRVFFGMNGVLYIEGQVTYSVLLSVLYGVVSVVLYGMCCIC